MGISSRTASFLKNLGYPATHLSQEGLHRLSDSEILQKVRKDGSILFTHDLDFDDLFAASEAELPNYYMKSTWSLAPERSHDENPLRSCPGIFPENLLEKSIKKLYNKSGL
jgi:hypothetical protein